MIKARKLKLMHNQAPAFLYDREMWDPDNMDEGLFKGHLPILVSSFLLAHIKSFHYDFIDSSSGSLWTKSGSW